MKRDFILYTVILIPGKVTYSDSSLVIPE